MRKDIFAIPIFEDKFDLSLLDPWDEEDFLNPVDSDIRFYSHNKTFTKKVEINNWTKSHLEEIVTRNLEPEGLMGDNPRLGDFWRNYYRPGDYQDIHIHPKTQWGIIIYEKRNSKTSFQNPSIIGIQNQIGYIPQLPLDYKPDLEPGSIIIFPAFLMHAVFCADESGSTISGMVYMDYPS
tara:strand:- start:14074 stop:14613 length:540 start_codon:yes stop_codon:yes gene_type:complete